VQSIVFDRITAKATRLFCCGKDFAKLWQKLFSTDWQSPEFWYPSSAPIDTYGPGHEQEIRRRLWDQEEQAFGEFMSKRKCLEEYDRIATIL
jgi:hypothetical protein